MNFITKSYIYLHRYGDNTLTWRVYNSCTRVLEMDHESLLWFWRGYKPRYRWLKMPYWSHACWSTPASNTGVTFSNGGTDEREIYSSTKR